MGKILNKQGYYVYLPDVSEKGLDAQGENTSEKNAIKRAFISQHFEKIQKSDAVLIAYYEKNGVPGYIGSNSLMEIGLAFFLNKTIILLFPPGDQPSQDEVIALTTQILDGAVDRLHEDFLQ